MKDEHLTFPTPDDIRGLHDLALEIGKGGAGEL